MFPEFGVAHVDPILAEVGQPVAHSQSGCSATDVAFHPERKLASESDFGIGFLKVSGIPDKRFLPHLNLRVQLWKPIEKCIASSAK